ncbi:MAG: Hsp20/alpha crystallin family protein [Deltaproteobacteria bacterium]|nr:Hsp20/alpha crystallin family protein [Deltaproteobacteria bacterium]
MAGHGHRKDEGESVEKRVPVPVEEERRRLSPFEDMEKWFDNVFNRRFFPSGWFPRSRFLEEGAISPSVDIFEDGDELVVKAEVPGMKKDEIEVNISGDYITISGEKKTEEKVEKKNYYRYERSFGSFNRRLPLPVETRIDEARATFRDGILEIRLPKTEKARVAAKKIPID